MKKNIMLYSLLLITAALVSGCASGGAALIEAPNGKTYFVDTTTCETYKLKGDSMLCYTGQSRCDITTYKPVTTGCQSQKVCGTSHTVR